MKGRRYIDTRTWRDRRDREIRGWDPLIQPLADAYIAWKHGASRPLIDPTHDPRYNYEVSVIEIFTMQQRITFSRSETSVSPPIDLAAHGFLAKTAVAPEVAVGFRTLELFHRIRLRKASMSVEAFTKVLCDYYQVLI